MRNRYSHSVALDLLGADGASDELANLRLSEIFERALPPERGQTHVLIFDQFEELLVLDPTDRDNQAAFFRELGEALAERELWSLFSIREDYMGGLDRFARYLPGHLAATYRLDFLDHEAAEEAIQLPARDEGVKFTDDAAKELVRKMAITRIQSPEGDEEEVVAPYVHPVQLQVVCNALWRSVCEERQARGASFKNIKPGDVKERANIRGAYQDYYATAVRTVADQTGADEDVIRTWFAKELITPQHFRSQTLTGPSCKGIDSRELLRALEKVYLVSSDVRAQSAWYELSHDQLIEPILTDNKRWERRSGLRPWRLAAREWTETHADSLLLHPWTLELALQEAEELELTHQEKAFLKESQRAVAERGRLLRMRTSLRLAYAINAALSVAVLVLLTLLLAR